MSRVSLLSDLIQILETFFSGHSLLYNIRIEKKSVVQFSGRTCVDSCFLTQSFPKKIKSCILIKPVKKCMSSYIKQVYLNFYNFKLFIV